MHIFNTDFFSFISIWCNANNKADQPLWRWIQWQQSFTFLSMLIITAMLEQAALPENLEWCTVLVVTKTLPVAKVPGKLYFFHLTHKHKGAIKLTNENECTVGEGGGYISDWLFLKHLISYHACLCKVIIIVFHTSQITTNWIEYVGVQSTGALFYNSLDNSPSDKHNFFVMCLY